MADPHNSWKLSEITSSMNTMSTLYQSLSDLPPVHSLPTRKPPAKQHPTPSIFPRVLAALLSLMASVATQQVQAQSSHETTARPLPLRALFLGDKGPHRPSDRFKQIEPVLTSRNIEVVYTDSLDALNPARLAGFDALIIYANHPAIGKDQENALLSFVEAGGGFVPIHCASFCFHNSPRYIELVGGRFSRHGTGVFKEVLTAPDHPILHGTDPIESWDETYVHSHHNPNRRVLAERVEGSNREPWTWVRQHGQGRVFYTAWGHDERTWGNAGFHDLIERGIRWSAENSPTRLTPRVGAPVLTDIESNDALPNYTANARWGTQGEPIRSMQQSLSPEDSLQHLVTLPGFDAQTFAAEPDVVNPIWIAWDERGRLWVAETVDYPNELQPEGQGRDRIKICEDTNGDGKADRFTVFADGLSVPTGFVFASGGIIVIHSGRTEMFKDTTGDDRADVREVLFTGWNMSDTHATASNLRYGFDNWIWGVVGYSGFRGTVGGREVRFGQGIFRFKTDGSELEFMRSSNNNTWGLGFSEEGWVFGSTANGNASMYLPIANRHYEQVGGWSASRLETIADSQRFYPITERVRQVDYHGRYTAGAGAALYTARQFPSSYWNQVQFVAEPTGHLLGRFHLRRNGTDFTAHNGRNFLASTDEWTSPVAAEVGPDGALWIADWYNYIIQHNPTPQGFTSGPGNAYETPLRDKLHGRILRVQSTGAKAPPAPVFSNSDPASYVSALANDNLLWRLHAQRLLVERNSADVIPHLIQLIKDTRVDSLGLAPAAIHALWTLNGLNAWNNSTVASEALNAALGALHHPSPAVRYTAASVLPRTVAARDSLIQSGTLTDVHPMVRLATSLALSEMPVANNAGSVLLDTLMDPVTSTDRWLPDALTAAAAPHDAAFLQAVLTRGDASEPPTPESAAVFARVVRIVTTHYARREPLDSIVATLLALQHSAPAVAVPVLDGLVAGWPQGSAPTLSKNEAAQLVTLIDALPESVRDRLLALATRWERTDLFGKRYDTIVASLKTRLGSEALEDTVRVDIARRLLGLVSTPDTFAEVLQPITLLASPDLSVGLIQVLADQSHPEVARALTDHWTELAPTARRSAVAGLLRRPEWIAALLDAVEAGKIDRGDLSTDHWAQLRQVRNREVARRVERLSTGTRAISADREAVVQGLLPVAKRSGDPTRGREVYVANCLSCHVLDGEGGKIGPDLTGVGAKDRSEILIDILDPNRSVEANYRLWQATTKGGDTFAGRLEAETRTTVEILDTTGQKHVLQRADLAELIASNDSIMPTGLESLGENDLASLLEYLAHASEHP